MIGGALVLDAEFDIWLKVRNETAPKAHRIAPKEHWTAFTKPRCNPPRTPALSFSFNVGDRVTVSNSYEMIGGKQLVNFDTAGYLIM
jgi:hypothetical protein